MKMIRNALLLITAITMIGGAFVIAPVSVHAQEASPITEGIEGVGETIVLQDNDPRVIAGRIINVVLGLLAIILVSIIVYAGFLYMTSGGDQEKTRKALLWIRNAIIGLVIILLSWAIARYVIEKLSEAVTGPGGGGSGPIGPPGGFGGAGGDEVFRILSITPQGEIENRKVVVKIIFNKPVDEESAAVPGTIVVETADGTAVEGTVSVQRSAVHFTPSDPCPPPNADRFCLNENADYRVRVLPALRSVSGLDLTCGGFAPDCEAEFRTGTTVDVTPPEVRITFPLDDFPVSADALVDVTARATDNVGVSYLSFFDNGEPIGDDAPEDSTPRTFNGRVQWDTAGLAPGDRRLLTATAYDTDTGVTTSEPVTAVIRPAHCFDEVQNEGETGVDCGGDPNQIDQYCGACSGDACTENADCASGFCINGFCAAQPVITSVAPDNGAPGTYVTVRGQNFGSNGTIYFLGPGNADPIEAPRPQACLDEGVNTWSSTQVVVEVPDGAMNGPLRLVNSVSGLSDDTNTPPGADIPDFLVNNERYPGICAVVPSSGHPADLFRLLGTGFGSTSAGVNFGQSVIASIAWADAEVQAYVPNVLQGSYPVSVTVGSERSNDVRMDVAPVSGGGAPEILEISPVQGPVGTYVTILGRNFGYQPGQVFFMNQLTEDVALADTNFPPECASGYWTDRNIVVKVPRQFSQAGNLTSGPYAVWVRTARAGAPESNRENFGVNEDPPTPGICTIVPRVAPQGTNVTIYGESLTGGPGTVRYTANRLDSPASWANTTISSRIPMGAETGPVTAEPASLETASNPYLLEVRNCNESAGICSASEECCGDGSCREIGQCPEGVGGAMFAWQFSTGLIPRAPRVVEQCENDLLPSPAPWSVRPGGEEACVNDVISILFSTSLDPTTVDVDAFVLSRCTGSGSNPCDTRASIDVGTVETGIATGSSDEGRSYVLLRPGTLNTSAWYEVGVKASIRGDGPSGIPMEEDAARCGAGIAYCFRFHTRADPSPCEIGSVLVKPDPYTAREMDETIDYAAVPRPVGDVCRVLDCDPYDWQWSTDPPRADITNDRVGGRGACRQEATAKLETEPGNPVQVSALERGSGVAGAGDLSIEFTDPIVQDFGPDCDTTCINAAIWAEFNIAMNPASISAENIDIYRCSNENCNDYLEPPTLDLSPPSTVQLLTVPGVANDARRRFLLIEPLRDAGKGETAPLLEPGRFYRVVLKSGTPDGIRSLGGTPLSGLNHPDGFAWTFRVKFGEDAYCTPDRVDVSPTEKIETVVGARQGFSATPFTAPDACSEKGQLLVASSGYAWSSLDQRVAVLYQNGRIDTGPNLPLGCNANCTLQGAGGRYGMTAQCGNGIIETTLSSYCVNGTTPFGQACTLLDPRGSGGEECDGQANCNSLCLWEPVDTVNEGGTCGNGVIDYGEDCDFGRTCRGTTNQIIPDGRDCTDPAAAAQCAANGGTCETRLTRGCSLNCRNLGSIAGGSTCGNNDIGDGEDCDNGNGVSGDGCSSNCLHEGSRPSAEVTALCGNGRIEPGESCEATNGQLPATCDPDTCLNIGRRPCLVTASNPNPRLCCGNGRTESGEDCDDGNSRSGDGCSAVCLNEGSSHLYDVPSFCGDEFPGTGEARACEIPPIRDNRTDAFQLAEIVGEADLPEGEDVMSTEIRAVYEGKTGTATYGLRCGFNDERLCSDDKRSYDSGVGLTSNGCCSLRPSLEDNRPQHGETNACRNALIRGSFNTLMDTESLTNNFIVAKRVEGTACPEGLSIVMRNGTEEGEGSAIGAMLLGIWHSIKAFFGASEANAQAVQWCAGAVSGVLQFGEGIDELGRPRTTFAYTLDQALEPDTEYLILFRGDTDLTDNAETGNRAGIRSSRGVVADRNFEWSFTTGQEICTVSTIKLTDEAIEHPNLFLKANESHPFIASALSIRDGRAVYISATPQYAWVWQNWALSNNRIANVNPPVEADQNVLRLSTSERSIISTDVSGSGFVSARVRITADAASVPSTAGRVVEGTAPITVNVCENPWPSRIAAPFSDEEGSLSLDGTIFENGPFFNFSMMYCRDAGAPGPNEDVPAIQINAVPENPADRSQGILRQYLFTFAEPELKKDAIGLRIASNPLHLSPLEWYRSRGFSGSPEELRVDGYEAIRDGRTVYVSAMNTEAPGEPMYSNIYIISYNDDAEAVTREIYDALIESMTFNTNLQEGVAAACEDDGGNLITGSNGLPVSCDADWQCDRYGANLICANFKGKVQRDMLRLSGFQNLTQALEAAKSRDGRYPRLDAGSYLPGLTTSMWPSWTTAFTEAVLPQGGVLPEDPVNRFVTCGRCSESGSSCVTAQDCPRSGEQCYAEDGFDPVSCWNATSLQYRCPKESDDPSSHLYQYRSLDTGNRFELAAEFEVPPPSPTNPSDGWWTPALFEELRQCTTPNEQGRFCRADEDCRTCPAGVCSRCQGGAANGQACASNADCPDGSCIDNVAVVTGSCQAIGGRYRYTNVCEGQSYGQSSTCGDGVIDSNPDSLACLGGPNDGRDCRSAADCDAFPCEPREICETSGPSSSRFEACTTASGAPGQKLQACSGCRTYVDDLSQPGCFAVSECGNGRIDQGETCDDGALNGTYGHCNTRCTGYGGFCGDGMLSLGEACDFGFTGTVQNGQYCTQGYACDTSNSCNLSCTGPGPFCGDQRITAPQEACDGNAESTDQAICSDGETPCDTNADCPVGRVCGGGISGVPACPVSRVCAGPGGFCSSGSNTCVTDADCDQGAVCVPTAGRVCDEDDDTICGGAYCQQEAVPTVRTRTCDAASCAFTRGWPVECRGVEFCGNGVVEGDEACDDGNDDNTDGCTIFCEENVCGDRFVYEGVEECDLGTSLNGQPCFTAEYGSTCTACSRDCKFQLTQGGFCGDGIVNAGSAEQCDTAGDPNAYAPPGPLTCRALGYDYAVHTTGQGGQDLITCSQSCGYTGCAYCGDVPSDPSAAVYQGKVEGVLFDTLFQQPVPEARITLFYRGLQVAVTTSDGEGYFELDGLDRHDGCNQYRLVIDSYRDNPLTEIFDESVRQGYMPIQTPSFEPDYRVAPVETGYTDAMEAWGEDTRRVMLIANPQIGRNYEIPRFNMLPRLRENEYVVQFWWEPLGGYDAVEAQFQNANPSTYPSLYAGYVNELHDLVVRTPTLYAPGQFGGCSLPDRAEDYNPTRAASVNANGVFTSYNGRNPSGSFVPGVQGVDHAVPYGGMLACTNKVRASLSKTCQKHECNDTDNDPTTPCVVGPVVPGGDYGGRIGCVVDNDCRNANQPSKYGLTTEAGEIILCDGPPEPSRQGDIDVLSGAEGAYLFCYHPEYPLGSLERSQSQCANFVLPPQSVFISGKGGQYDILVSKYRLFAEDWKMDIRDWLMDRHASIVVYDEHGFNQERSVTRASRYGNGTWWGSDDGVPRWCSRQGGTHDTYAAVLSAYRSRMSQVSPVWTPLSIDTTNKRYIVWNNGNAGADYQYFSDLVHREDFFLDGPGDNAGCYERACERIGYSDGTTFPVGDYKICGGSTGAHAFPDPADGPAEDSPACNEESRAACNPGTYCNTHVDDTVPCVRICDTYRDCQADPRVTGFRDDYVFCGGVAIGPCGTGSENPALR